MEWEWWSGDKSWGSSPARLRHVPDLVGASYGELDEIGFRAVTDHVSVHDLHGTMLHLLGIDYQKLTYFHNGRRYRLIDVAGEVLRKILA